MSHTPGPWFAVDGGEDDEWGISSINPEKDSCDVAQMVWERDAPLIAAAPDLLEACRVVLELLDTMDEGTRRFHVERAVLKHAIAKAESR